MNNQIQDPTISDDSDSDEEKEFETRPAEKKQKKLKKAAGWSQTAKASAYERCLLRLESIPKPDLKYRPRIPRDEKFDRRQANADLELINEKVKAGEPLTTEFLEQLPTKFAVAQYRGIHYMTTQWDAAARRRHRILNEVGHPQYSSAVLNACDITNFTDYMDALNVKENQDKLMAKAKELQESLLSMLNSHAVAYKGYVYRNLFYLLQSWYSANYNGLPERLKIDLSKPTESVFGKFLFNHHRPLLSSSDHPYHALKYAYGLKLYEEHKEERLEPKWRKDGRAQSPYAGKIYVSLHPLTDYTDFKPSHITSLFKQALVTGGNVIAVERETSFLGYLPENRILFQHKAKYPSFKNAYKKIYAYKYGVSEKMFIKIRAALVECQQTPDKSKILLNLLGEYFCAYQEVRLIDKARRKAEKQGKILIYRDEDGGFSLYHAETPTTSNKRLGGLIAAKKELYHFLASNERDKNAVIYQKNFIANEKKFNYIKENFSRIMSDELPLRDIFEIPLEILECLTSNNIQELIIDGVLDWNELVVLTESRLSIISNDEVLALIEMNATTLSQLLQLPLKKLNLLTDEFVLDLLHLRLISITEIQNSRLKSFTALLEFDGLQNLLTEGYSLAELVELYEEDPFHLTYLTEEDLTQAVYDDAPDVSDLLLDYATQKDTDFDWVRSELGENSQFLFDARLNQYFRDKNNSEEEQEEPEYLPEMPPVSPRCSR